MVTPCPCCKGAGWPCSPRTSHLVLPSGTLGPPVPLRSTELGPMGRGVRSRCSPQQLPHLLTLSQTPGLPSS